MATIAPGVAAAAAAAAVRWTIPYRRLRHSFFVLSSKAETFSTVPGDDVTPIVELRQYRLHPSQTSLYTQRTVQTSSLRKELPLAFFGFPETGGIPLNTAVHLYRYEGGHGERSERRAALAGREEWRQYLAEVKVCMADQSSGIFVEAGMVDDVDGIEGLKRWIDDDRGHGTGELGDRGRSVVELRKYQLRLGYDAVPKFLRIYSEALPSKLNAVGTHPTTQLVTILVSDIGSLNVVYEVWKHGGKMGDGEGSAFCGIEAMEQSRRASRTATEWRRGIANIAELATDFDTTILKPLVFSPLG